MLPLEGLKVVDLSRQAPGPYCTMLLGDLGADVTIVEETPGAGRRFDAGMSGRLLAHWALTRNKRSIGLNLKDSRAQEAVLKLADSADILVEGYRPGVVKRLGVDYEKVSKRNPRIIYLSLSGFGQTGPYAELVGHDINYISVSGALAAIGWPQTPPAIPLNVLADFGGGGLYAAFATLVAVVAREKTGRGQYIDMAMSDGVISLLAASMSLLLAGGRPPRRGQDRLNGGVPSYNVYETADAKWLSIGALEPWFWSELCKALDCEQFIPHQADREMRAAIFDLFRAKFKEKTRDAWFEELRHLDICITPVLDLDEVTTDAHSLAREMVIDVDHPVYGSVKQVGIAPKFSETPGKVRSGAPERGQHTDEVLREVNYTDKEIDDLRKAGVAG
jgi:crotonobetainyl-CoA:carnitine CoA-transferase CaiB-like acyl-CoA transferase